MGEAIERNCSCLPLFLRRDENISNKSCVGEGLTCMEKMTRSWGSSEDDLNKAVDARTPLGPQKLCHDNCERQELRVVTSRSGYPKKRTLPLTEDFCLNVEKMRNVCNSTNRRKAFE